MSAVITPYRVCNRCEDFNVGYVNDTIDQYNSGSVLITPQFIGMGSDGAINLQDIKCPETAYGKISMQQLNGDGSTRKVYLWKRKYDKAAKVYNYGWMDADNQDAGFIENVTFEPGDGFWLQNDGEEGVNTFNTSGAVNQKDITYPLAWGSDSVICGNSFPQKVNLQDILCPTTAYGKIALQLLNGDGSTKKVYLWKRKWDKSAKVYNFGWMDADNQDAGFIQDVVFKAGQGFWVQCDGTEADAFAITFPGVEL